MIDRIGQPIRSLVKKKQEEDRPSDPHSQTSQEKNKEQHGQEELAQGQDGQMLKVRIPLPKLQIILTEINAHPYYQSKKIIFKLADKHGEDDRHEEEILVCESESGKIIKTLSHYKLLLIQQQLGKVTSTDNRHPEKGHLVNISC